ncbi:MAG: hypothetical protein IPO22_22295 [Anaerolineales bacterium]|nr:hypothetical protein [Anaerolineales bacterium]
MKVIKGNTPGERIIHPPHLEMVVHAAFHRSTVVYREERPALPLPAIALRVLAIANVYFGFGENLTARSISTQLSLVIFVVPFIFSFIFLARKQIDMAGAFFSLQVGI